MLGGWEGLVLTGVYALVLHVADFVPFSVVIYSTLSPAKSNS